MMYTIFVTIMVVFTLESAMAHDRQYFFNRRDRIRLLCETSFKEGHVRYEDIYNLFPDEKSDYYILLSGTDDQKTVESWVWLNEDNDGRKCKAILAETVENTPVRTIYTRIKGLINHQAFDMKSIIPPNKHNWSMPWPSYAHLFDVKLAPLPPGFKFRFTCEEEKRRAKFKALIKADGKDFLEKMILFATFNKDGSHLTDEIDNLNFQYFIDGTGFRFATKAELADLPNWYLAWNHVMPMLCTRYNNWGPAVQTGCPWINSDE